MMDAYITVGMMPRFGSTVQGSNLGVQGSLTAPTQMFGSAMIKVNGEIKGGIKGAPSTDNAETAKIIAGSCGKLTKLFGTTTGSPDITGAGC